MRHPDFVPKEKPFEYEQRSFISSDGTPIGYQVAGREGAPVLLLANGLGGTIETYRFIINSFSHLFRFYCWDYRGLYTSGRPLGGYAALSIPHHASDGLELLEQEGITHFHALGWSMGVQVLLEMSRNTPQTMDSLVLLNGAAGTPYRSVLGVRAFENAIPWFLRKLQKVDTLVTKSVHWTVDFPAFISLMIHLRLVHPDLHRDVFLDVARGFQHIDLHLYMELLLRLGEHDASDVLSSIGCPTLVLAGSNDLLTPLSNSERLANTIPTSQLEIVPGGSHYTAVEFPDVLNQLLERFFLKNFSELYGKPH